MYLYNDDSDDNDDNDDNLRMFVKQVALEQQQLHDSDYCMSDGYIEMGFQRLLCWDCCVETVVLRLLCSHWYVETLMEQKSLS